MSRVMRQALEGVESVIHLAAYQDYMPDFSSFIHTNTESSALIFEIAVSDPRRYPLRKVVFASSQSVSGEGRYVCTHCAGGVDAPTIAEQLALPALAYDFPHEAVHVPAPRPMGQLRKGEWEVRCPKCEGAMSPLLIDEMTVASGNGIRHLQVRDRAIGRPTRQEIRHSDGVDALHIRPRPEELISQPVFGHSSQVRAALARWLAARHL